MDMASQLPQQLMQFRSVLGFVLVVPEVGIASITATHPGGVPTDGV